MGNLINQDQVTGVLRIIVPLICAMLTPMLSSLGDASIVAQITTLCVGLVAIVWSFRSHSDSAKIAAAATVHPGVKIQVPLAVVTTDSKIAALIDDHGTYKNVTTSMVPTSDQLR